MKRNGFAEVVPAIRFIVQAIDKTFGGCGLLNVEFIKIKDKETASPRVGLITEYRLILEMKVKIGAYK